MQQSHLLSSLQVSISNTISTTIKLETIINQKRLGQESKKIGQILRNFLRKIRMEGQCVLFIRSNNNIQKRSINVFEFHEILNEPQLGLLGPLLTPFVLYLEPFAPHVGHDHNRRVESRPRASWHVFRSSLKDRPEKATLAFDFDRVRLEYPRTNDRSPGKLRLSRLRLLLCETF